jgi:yeast amino acid transporter
MWEREREKSDDAGSGSDFLSAREVTELDQSLRSHSLNSNEFHSPWGQTPTARRPSTWKRTIDGFKRDRSFTVAGRSVSSSHTPHGADGRVFDAEAAAMRTAESPLMRRLKGRHLQMIAFGGSIGTGLFVSSGKALANGGPASLVMAYCIIGIMLYCTVHALGEMSVIYPVAGSFSAFSTRFLDPAWGFAMGWNYALQWLVILPLETVSASIILTYWSPDLPVSAFVSIFLLLIVVINLFGVKGYGEMEFIFSIIKVVMIIGFM